MANEAQPDTSSQPEGVVVGITINKMVSDPQLLNALLRRETVYGIVGIVLAAVFGAIGAILTLTGAVGHTNAVFKLLGGGQIEVNDAGPGVILMIVAAAVVVFTRPSIKLTNVTATTSPPSGGKG